MKTSTVVGFHYVIFREFLVFVSETEAFFLSLKGRELHYGGQNQEERSHK